MRARAASDAALLIGPSIRLDALKLPTAAARGNAVSDPLAIGPEYQVRAGLMVSPIAMYKGLKVLDVGDADCEQHLTLAAAQEVMAQDKDYGRAPAIAKQIAYLDAQRTAWEAVAAKGEQRFDANATTLQQVEEIRTRVMSLSRQRAQLEGEKERLEANGAKAFQGTLADLSRAVESTAMTYERKVSTVRTLDNWNVSLTGGYIPPVFGAESSDFYGMVSLSHNLGGTWRNAAETRYLGAREDELKTSPYEVAGRLTTFRTTIKSVSAQAKREVSVVEGRISALSAGRAALETSEALKAAHALALLDLELIAAESERTYLNELIVQLRKLEEN